MHVYVLEKVSNKEFVNIKAIDDRSLSCKYELHTEIETVLPNHNSIKNWCLENSIEEDYYWRVTKWKVTSDNASWDEVYRVNEKGEKISAPLQEPKNFAKPLDSSKEYMPSYQPYNVKESLFSKDVEYAFTHIWSGLKIIKRKINTEISSVLNQQK